MLDGEEHDAPAGTLVHCPPDTLRGAVAAEPGTTVRGIGAKPGEVFKPSGWEWTFAGMSLLNQGDEQAARREFEAGLEAYPDAWQGYYNLACAEARLGNRDEAIDNLRRAAELDQAVVTKYALEDEDFASLKDDPDFLAIARQTNAAGPASWLGERVHLRAGDQQHRAVPCLADQRVDEQLQADRERERLVRVLAAERHELVVARLAR